MTSASAFAPHQEQLRTFDRILVGTGIRLVTWGRRRAARRRIAHIESGGNTHVEQRDASERAATERMITSHFGIR